MVAEMIFAIIPKCHIIKQHMEEFEKGLKFPISVKEASKRLIEIFDGDWFSTELLTIERWLYRKMKHGEIKGCKHKSITSKGTPSKKNSYELDCESFEIAFRKLEERVIRENISMYLYEKIKRPDKWINNRLKKGKTLEEIEDEIRREHIKEFMEEEKKEERKKEK
jgi:hypothetical protein